MTLPEPTSNPGTSTADEILGYFLMTMAGFSGALDTVIQKARLNGENPLVLNFWTSISMIVIPLILCLITELDYISFPTDFNNIVLVLGHVLSSALSMILAVRGIAMTTAIWLTLALSMQIFFLIISQYTVLKSVEPGKGNWIKVFGACVIFIGAIIPPLWEVLKVKFNSPTLSIILLFQNVSLNVFFINGVCHFPYFISCLLSITNSKPHHKNILPFL